MLVGTEPMELSSSLSLTDYWHTVLRRKWLALAIFSVCLVGASTLCSVLPESYRSQTLILVEGQKIPENYVQAVIGPTIEERLNSLQQQIMSRTVLTQVIHEFGLYPEIVHKNGIDSVIDRLRKDIRVTTMGARSQRGGIDAFSISFAHENPKIAMNVTAKLASHFIEENLKVREQLVEGASEFLEQELVLAKERLETQERTISQYKTKYMGELPEQVQANISALDRLQAQHTAASEALQKSTDRLTLIEKMIKEHEASGMVLSGVVQGAGGALIGDPLVLRLKELEKNLATLSAEYKDNYPDIIYLRQEIQSLKAQLKDKKDKVREKDETEKSLASAKDLKPIDLYLRELIRQRDEVRLEIASVKDRLTRTRLEMKEYERRVEKAPLREQEMQILIRDYNNLKENYRALLDKKLNARLAENLEKRQKGEQFRIIDPANLPQKPESPDRLKIMLIGLLLGCGVGMGSAIALESFHPVFMRSDDVEALLRLRVLACIPNFTHLLRENKKFLHGGATVTAWASTNKRLWLPARISKGQQNQSDESKSGSDEAGMPAPQIQTPAGLNKISREWDLIGKWSPWSVVAEQFRVAATRLALLQSDKGGKVTVVTSSLKGEGKSVVSANLAFSLARDLGKMTLLVDGDLKCPTIHQYMGISQSPGLREVIQEGQAVDCCIQRVGELPLWVLPSGGKTSHMLELSRIRQIGGIVSEFKGRYDHIIIDAPPILPLADMHVFASMADTLIFVIRSGITPRSVVERAVRTLGMPSNACIILNGLDTAGVPYYMQEGYEYMRDIKGVQSK